MRMKVRSVKSKLVKGSQWKMASCLRKAEQVDHQLYSEWANSGPCCQGASPTLPSLNNKQDTPRFTRSMNLNCWRMFGMTADIVIVTVIIDFIVFWLL